MAARLSTVIQIKCPHCEGKAKIRSSEEVIPMVRDLYLQCQDLGCGHTWKAQLSFAHTICPSARPKPGLVLAMGTAPSARRKLMLPAPANDEPVAAPEVPPAANDDHPVSEAM